MVTTRSAANTAHNNEWFERVARGGFAASGVLHVFLAWIVLMLAFGQAGSADQSGALAALSALVPAMRSYIVRQVSGPRCASSMKDKSPSESIRDFNGQVQLLNRQGTDYKEISPEESTPLKDEGPSKLVEFWQSARSKKVLEALRWLNHGNRDLPDDKRFWTGG